MRLPLTDLAIRSLKTNSQTRVMDTNLRGFGVLVGKYRKTFIVITGRERRLATLGHYPDVSLQDARRKARHLLLASDTTSVLFHEALDRYVALHLKPNTKPRTAYQLELVLKKYFAHFNTSPLHRITRPDITRTIDDLRGTPATAKQALSVLSAFLNWCVGRSLLATNPIVGYRANIKTKARDRLLTDDEIRLIWRESYNHNSFGDIVRLLILTGQRLNQIACLKHEWLHHNSYTIQFPAYIMKGNSEHVIPLTPILLSTLNTPSHVFHHTVRTKNDNSSRLLTRNLHTSTSPNNTTPFLFPAPCGTKPFSSTSTAMHQFRAALPDMAHWTLHDFRRYFSSTHAKLGTPLDVTEALLAHTSGSRSAIQRTYDRYDRIVPMRSALERYETFLGTFLNFAEHPPLEQFVAANNPLQHQRTSASLAPAAPA